MIRHLRFSRHRLLLLLLLLWPLLSHISFLCANPADESVETDVRTSVFTPALGEECKETCMRERAIAMKVYRRLLESQEKMDSDAISTSPLMWNQAAVCNDSEASTTSNVCIPLSSSPHTSKTARRLTGAGTAPTNFILIRGKGLLGHKDSPAIAPATAQQCADECTNDVRCLSFDMRGGNVCYLSFSDRWHSPDDFITVSDGDYYEWQTQTVQAPQFYPNGGAFSAIVATSLLSTARAGNILYAFVDPSEPDGVFPSDSSRIIKTDVGATITLPAAEGSWKIVACVVRNRDTERSPMATSSVFRLSAGQFAFLVPYYDGTSLHGRATRVQLDLTGRHRARPAKYHELSSFESDTGTGPYVGQVKVVDFAASDARFVGYMSGFSYTVASTGVEYAYFVPFRNNNGFHGNLLRIPVANFVPGAVEGLDLTQANSRLTGFSGSVVYGQYAYLISQRSPDGSFAGLIARLDLENFSLDGVRTLDLTRANKDYRGFSSICTDGIYIYLIPFANTMAPIGLENSIYAADLGQLRSHYHGRVVRVLISSFSLASVEALDLTQASPDLRGYSHGFVLGPWLYLSPRRIRDCNDRLHMKSSYLCISSYLTRVSTLDFETVEVLDLSEVDGTLRGFRGGFAFGDSLYLVPYRNGITSKEQLDFRSTSGTVPKISSLTFRKEDVDIIDFSTSNRVQVPPIPDADLQGFLWGFANGSLSCRQLPSAPTDLTVGQLQVLDVSLADSSLVGFSHGFAGGFGSNFPQKISQFDNWRVAFGSQLPYNFSSVTGYIALQ